MPEFSNIYRTCVDAADRDGLPFLLIGGHAVNARGYQRTTLDLDFLIPVENLAAWQKVMEVAGYQMIHETRAFAQFDPVCGEGFRVDIMLVNSETFAKLFAGSDRIDYGGRRVQVVGVLHLIALKLHATRTWDRAVQGKDYYDILNLINVNRIDPNSPEFQTILKNYASASIQERLLRDLQNPL